MCVCVCVVCTHFVIYGPRVFYSIFVAFFLAEGGIEIVFRNTRKCLLNFPQFPSFFSQRMGERVGGPFCALLAGLEMKNF